MGIIQVPYVYKPEFDDLRVDWSNPLAQGLVFLAYPGGVQNFDLIGGAGAILLSTNNSFQGVDLRGSALLSTETGTGAGARWASTQRQRDLVNSAGVNYTIAVSVAATTLTQFCRLVVAAPANTSPDNYFSLTRNGSTSGIRLGGPSGLSSSATGFLSAPSASRIISASADGVNDRYYLNGGLLSTVAKARTGNPTAMGGGSSFYLLGNQEVSRGTAGSSGFVAIWLRTLADSEHAAIADNIYAVLRQPEIYLKLASTSTAQNLSVSLAGASTVAIGLTVNKRLIVAIAGSSSIAVGLAIGKRLSVSLAGTSTIAIDLTVDKRLTVAIAGNSSIAVGLAVSKRLSVLLAGTSTVVIGLTVSKSLTVAISGASTVAIGLVVSSPGLLAVAISGNSSIAVGLAVSKRLSVLLAGTSTVVIGLTVSKSLAVAISGTSTVEAQIQLEKVLQVAVSGLSAIQASLVVGKLLQLQLTGLSSIGLSLSGGGTLPTPASRTIVLPVDGRLIPLAARPRLIKL